MASLLIKKLPGEFLIIAFLVCGFNIQPLPAYNYQDPNILIAAPILKTETYTPISLLILNLPSGGSEIVINSAARDPKILGENL